MGGHDRVQPGPGALPDRRDDGGATGRVRRAVVRPEGGRALDRPFRLVRRLVGQARAGARLLEPGCRPVLQLHRARADRRRRHRRPRGTAARGPGVACRAGHRRRQRGRRRRRGALAAPRGRARRGLGHVGRTRRRRERPDRLPRRAGACARGTHGRQCARSRRRRRAGRRARAPRRRQREARRARLAGLAKPLGRRGVPRAEDGLAPDRRLASAVVTGQRRLSQAISEGDGISLLVPAVDLEAVRRAEGDGAEGVVVDGDLAGVRAATGLPILWRRPSSPAEALSLGADACLVTARQLEDDAPHVERRYSEATDLGLECVVGVVDDDDLEESRWGGPWLALAGVLVLAAALRLVGIRNGLPFPLLNPDERNIVPRAWGMVHGAGADPNWFDYPSLLLYVVAPFQWWHDEPSYLTARLVVAALGVGSVAAAWWLGSRAYGTLAGFVAAAATAVETTHVAYSRMAGTDIPLSLGVAVALALMVTGRIELAGLAAGLATSAKYPGVFLLAPLVAAGWRRWWRLAAAAGLAVLAFALTSPYVILDLGRASDAAWRAQQGR